jgi:hypothetical protein
MIRRIGIGIDFIFSGGEELESGLQFILNYKTESELELEYRIPSISVTWGTE